MKRAILLLLLISALSTSVSAQFPQSYGNRLQFVLDSVCSIYNVKGVSAAVTVPGIGTWEGIYGISETGVPMATNMALGIGSNTKTFIAAIILKMEEQNLISLSDTIGTWIQHPNVNGQITITQLLNHTSGVYNFTNSQAFEDSMITDFTRVWQPEDVLQFIEAPAFPAGTNWDYSNSNYLLLGLIIKQVTAQPLNIFLRNNILTPAGLSKTWLFPEETPVVPIAHSWSAAFNWLGSLEDIVATYNYSHNSMFSMAWAAGAIMSTASDNAQFWSKLITGQILSSASLAKMKQVVQLSSVTGYGLGIFRYKNFNGRTIYAHGGTNLGFINENLADSISGVGISVLTNQDSVSNSIVRTRIVAALHKVTTTAPLSVDTLNATRGDVTIYPNPAKGKINIQGLNEGDVSTLRIYDITGKEVYSKEVTSYRNITLPMLSTGTYLVKIEAKDQLLRIKKILQVVR